MYVSVYLQLERFYIPALSEAPELAVVHRDKIVLEADDGARGRGISAGMTLAEAKSILAGDGYFVTWEEEQFRSAQRAWIEAVAEFSDAIEPQGQHAAFVDLSYHPHPRETMDRLKHALQARFDTPVRAGLASARWVARQAALFGDPSGLALIAPRRFVSLLPTYALPLPEDVVRRLVLLGYRTVGEVSRLDFETLRKQFGELALDIRRMALGRGDSRVEAVFPANALSERFEYNGAPETSEVLENGLQVVADRLGRALKKQDASTAQVELFLEREDGTVEVVRRSFSKPVSSSRELMPGLRLLLETSSAGRRTSGRSEERGQTSSPLTPADVPSHLIDAQCLTYRASPVEAVRVRLCDVRKSKRVQIDLNGRKAMEDRERSLDAAIESARTAFGDHAVVRASDMPEPRWKKVRRAYSAVIGWAWA